ncbi:MAG: alpha/beta fold hydrolase, partial [bacterium]|nr:alpha/beta fold hydrolase [bacterium]
QKWTEADPTDAVSLYNFACCLSLLEQPDSAMVALTRAQQAGWSDSAHTADDPDLESLRTREDFQELLSEIARAARTRFGGYTVHTCPQERVGQYLVVLPEDYEPGKKYPLVVLLHGYGMSPEQFAEVASLINTRDFIYAVPEGPYPVLDAVGRHFSHFREHGDFREDETSARTAADWIVRVADDMITRYPVDTTRFSIVGFSQGGALAHVTAALYPDRIAGYCAVGGYFIPGAINADMLRAEQEHGVRALILHGRDDQAVGLEEGAYTFSALERAGLDAKMEIMDGGHRFTPQAGLKVNEWLRERSRP